MKAFRFRLERVLHYFRQQELVQSMAVADVERRIREIQNRCDTCVDQKDDLAEHIRLKHQTFTYEELAQAYARIEYLARTIRALEIDLQMVRVHLDEERTLLIDMTKRRRVVEELRSRKLAVHDAEIERYELAVLDEANSRRTAMNAQKEDKS